VSEKCVTKGQGGKKCPTSNRRKDNWIGNILHTRRHCLIKRVTKGEIEVRIKVTERRGRICK
jgi:hypothetical protein